DWVIETWTIGMSMLGNRVIGSDMKLTMPRISNTRNVTIAGIGERIDHAEMFSLIARLPGATRYPRPGEPRRRCAGRRRRAPRPAGRTRARRAARSHRRW